MEVGRTSEGRPFYLALISSPENLAQVDRYREISFRLAHPEGLSDTEARALAREGKAIVHIDGAVHASESAAHQHTIQLAYDLLTGRDDPEIQAIFDNVIFMLWPTLNPDGQTKVAEWYLSNVGTPYETSSMPELYQKYVGHDNNRDAYMLNMVESRVIGRTWREWEPQIVFVHHQSAPFPTRIWLPPFDEPVGNRVHPLMARTVNTLGMLMAQALEERGQVGATHMGVFDAWYPGYIDYLPMLQNAAAFWTETAGGSATPRFYTPGDVMAGGRDLRPQSLYSSPWPGGWWRLRDAVEYMETASIAVLDFAAKFKTDLLYNRYQAGRDAIQKYSQEPPYAYFIPQDQRDPVAPVELLRRLAFNGVRISQLERPVTHEGSELPCRHLGHPHGPGVRRVGPHTLRGPGVPGPPGVSRVGRRNGPMMSRDGPSPTSSAFGCWKPPNPSRPKSGRPWSRSGERPWTGGRTDEMARTPMRPPSTPLPGLGFNSDTVAAGIVPPPGVIRGGGSTFAVSPSQNNAFKAVNRAWESGASVRYESRTASPGDPDSGGRFIISGLGGGGAGESGEGPRASGLKVRAPGAWPWPGPGSASSGHGKPAWMKGGPDGSWSNTASTRESQERRHQSRVPDGSPGRDHPGRLRRPDHSGRAQNRNHPTPVRRGYRGRRGSGPGRVRIEWGHPGLPEWEQSVRHRRAAPSGGERRHAVCRATNSPSAARSWRSLRTRPILSWPECPPGLRSSSPEARCSPRRRDSRVWSWPNMSTRDHPSSRASSWGRNTSTDTPPPWMCYHGEGHVILLGFKPQWRGQPFGSFRTLFNAALFYGPHAASAEGDPGFWTPPEEGGKEEK